MYGTLRDELVGTLAEVREAGLYKSELEIMTPQGAHVDVTGRGELLNLCANNYLGLANHPAIVEAAHEALDRWGYGMASVRFICGTQVLHRELEERLSEFLGTDDTILYSSCFDANGGLFEALLGEEDAVISDQLNHASIIDGIRLCKARRLRYANGDMDELEARLEEASDARHRLIATDGVFSMDGYLAQLDRICELAERHGALVMVDDSHAVGVVGPGGRGTPEHHGVIERVDILTGTLGKAIGGASGGYVSGRREIVELLRQRSRPYLFSNSVAPPVAFHIAIDREQHPIDAEVVQAATKWKRLALRQFGLRAGEGVLTDMRAVRKDYFLDHDHSAYVDQWDWEQAIRPQDRTLGYLTATVRSIWKVLKEAEALLHERYPVLAAAYPPLPAELEFIHAEDILATYPDLPRKQRETEILQEHPAVFIYGIGWPLADGLPHELRAADYDDWSTETVSADGRPMHGLNGDILVWNPVTRRRHELMSGGIRVTKESLVRQLELSGQLDFLELPYHQAIMRDEIPLSIGAGIGQSRTMMLLLRKAHLGEVSVTVWPRVLKRMCAQRDIHVLE